MPDTIRLTRVQPGVAAFQDGNIIAQHQDYSLITPDAPALPGEIIVIYLAGMGLTDVPVGSGDPSPANPLARTVVPPSVTVGGKRAEIFFSGLTPGFVGLYQINLRIPADVTPGNAELVVTQETEKSNRAIVPIRSER